MSRDCKHGWTVRQLGIKAVFIILGMLALATMGEASECPATAADSNTAVNDCNGPTVLLDYGNNAGAKANSVASFMYFVPLLSPTLVENETSAINKQHMRITSYKKAATAKTFSVNCEFRMGGKGYQKTIYEPHSMIAEALKDQKKGKVMANALDFIKFEGPGLGSIDVKGIIDGSQEVVTEITLNFSSDDLKSPVTVGLYSIKSVKGEYKIENRFNNIIARVNTLSFKRGEAPKMGITVASISRASVAEGFASKMRGYIANLLLDPPDVTKLGNDTMLNFGHALYKQEPSFTFPKAVNLKK